MNIQINEKKFEKLERFLEKNHDWPIRYQEFAVSHACFGCHSAKQKLVRIFRSALLSNTGGALTSNANAIGEFRKKIRKLPDDEFLVPSEFMGCFRAKDLVGLFASLIGMKGVGPKKAALFLRDLWVTQNLPQNNRLFDPQLVREDELYIPLDIVIAFVLNQVVKRHLFRKGSDLSNAFTPVNRFFKDRLDGNHMIIEDLWFWGYFGLRNGGYDRDVIVNDGKIALDPFFGLHTAPTAQLRRFGKILSE